MQIIPVPRYQSAFPQMGGSQSVCLTGSLGRFIHRGYCQRGEFLIGGFFFNEGLPQPFSHGLEIQFQCQRTGGAVTGGLGAGAWMSGRRPATDCSTDKFGATSSRP